MPLGLGFVLNRFKCGFEDVERLFPTNVFLEKDMLTLELRLRKTGARVTANC